MSGFGVIENGKAVAFGLPGNGFAVSPAEAGRVMQPGYPVITTNREQVNFGTPKAGMESTTQIIAVQNSGFAPAIVSAINIPEGGTQHVTYSTTDESLADPLGALPVTLPVGDGGEVLITWSPLDEGVMSGSMTISSNATAKSIILSGTALPGLPIVTTDPSVIDFGSVDFGFNQTASRVLSITNTGHSPLIISNIAVPTGGAQNVILSTTDGSLTNPLGALPATIIANETRQILLTYTPQAVGSMATDMVIHSNTADKSVYLVGVPSQSDPYWNNVVLAMHMDGVNDSTNFIDIKGRHVLTPSGGSHIKTDTSKFGGASGYFPSSSGSFLTGSGNVADFDFGTGDYTIEFFVYLLGSGERYQCLLSFGTESGACMYIEADINTHMIGSANQTSTGVVGITTLLPASFNAWHHIAFVRNGNVFTMYQDGQFNGSATSTGSSYYSESAVLRIGRLHITSSPEYFNGYIDDLRITKGVARYTTNFTPPTAAFPSP